MNSKSTEITNEKLEEKNVVESSVTEVKEAEKHEESKVNDSTTVSTETKKTVTDSKESGKSDEKENKSETEEESKSETKEDEIVMKWIDKDFCYDLMSVPSFSDEEYRMVQYIILWARRNNIKYEFDKKGNIYLTKGELAEGEFYPCVTSHLDTVQTKQKAYAQAGVRLDIKTRVNKDKQHEIYVDGMGIGADDRSGILICLSMFKYFDKLKAAFFLCEERGCIGSKAMDISKLDDVGYVMGFDSPEKNRAAYACSCVRLFSPSFFTEYMEEICKEHGLTTFNSEPFTDVKVIRDKTDLICMNFGNGGYYAHMANEYAVLEEMDDACKMGIDLVKKIGNTKHTYKIKNPSSTQWVQNENGIYSSVSVKDEDAEFFRTKFDKYTSSYGGYYSGSKSYTSSTSSTKTTTSSATTTTTTSSSSTKEKENKDMISMDTLEYIVNKYDARLEEIKDNIKSICKESKIDFKLFEEAFNTDIKF